ncbi:hypothetical protein BpHYR1_003250, partial [Brachionus plicatilis]
KVIKNLKFDFNQFYVLNRCICGEFSTCRFKILSAVKTKIMIQIKEFWQETKVKRLVLYFLVKKNQL